MKATLHRLDEFTAYPRNAKEHDIGSIHVSITQWGFLERVVVNETTGHILSGHGRIKTLQQMEAAGKQPPEGIVIGDGTWLIPVDMVSVPEAQEGAVTIALNRTVERGGWDNEALTSLLQDISQRDMEVFEATGFDAEDLAELELLAEGFEPVEEMGHDIPPIRECPNCGHKF